MTSPRVPPPADDDEPFAPKNTYLLGSASVESPTALIKSGIGLMIGGPIFAVVAYLVTPPPRPAVAVLIAGGMGVLLFAIGAFVLYMGRRRRAWRLARGIPVDTKFDRPGAND